jgi:hypothetical protein
MLSFRSIFPSLLLAWPCFLAAQEVKYNDISHVHPRTELRHPPTPQSDCKEGTHCIGSGYGGGSVGDRAPDQRDPHALGIYLLRVTPTDINPTEPFQVEFKILNSGTAPIELPVSPHLSDLQPNDESVARFVEICANWRVRERSNGYTAAPCLAAPRPFLSCLANKSTWRTRSELLERRLT